MTELQSTRETFSSRMSFGDLIQNPAKEVQIADGLRLPAPNFSRRPATEEAMAYSRFRPLRTHRLVRSHASCAEPVHHARLGGNCGSAYTAALRSSAWKCQPQVRHDRLVKQPA